MELRLISCFSAKLLFHDESSMQGNGNATSKGIALLEGLLRHLDQNMSPNFLDLTEPQRGESAPEVIYGSL